MTILDSQGHGLAARLWEANRDLARVALGDHFARGVADGSLPADCFKAYVAQDAFILEAFARAYALALARSPDRHGLETFHTLITGGLDELRLHASYASVKRAALSTAAFPAHAWTLPLRVTVLSWTTSVSALQG